MKRLIAAAIAVFALAACANAPTISANPVASITSSIFPEGGTVVTGLQNAAYNLDQAIAINVLPADDPADKCVHASLKMIGQDVGDMPAPKAPEFQSKITDLISAGSVAYILAEQAKNASANGGITIPTSCEQLVGHFVLIGVNAPANAVIRALR